MKRCLVQAQAVAVMATAADFAMSWLLLAALPASDACTACAVAAGAATGAAVSCAANHLWTFQGNGNHPLTVLRRYAVVWIAGLAINTGGTVVLARHLPHAILAKAIVAAIVALLWNYPLFSHYVYRKASDD